MLEISRKKMYSFSLLNGSFRNTVNSRFKKDLKLQIHLHKGSFNNYVDTMRGGGGQNCLFLSRSGCKNCPHRGGGSKDGKIMSTQLLNDP